MMDGCPMLEKGERIMELESFLPYPASCIQNLAPFSFLLYPI
jgi:hypothetical protein